MKSSTQDVRYLSDKCAALETRLAEIEELDYHLRKRIAALERALNNVYKIAENLAQLHGVRSEGDLIAWQMVRDEARAALKGDDNDRD